MFILAISIVVQIVKIQFVQGDEYKKLAQKRTIQNVVIPANRGNVYSSEGNLLATSVPKYDIRFDAITPTTKRFEKYIQPLSDSLASFHGKSSDYYEKEIRRARVNKNRYLLLARNLGYSNYLRMRSFPLLNMGSNSGGLIVEQKTKREHPMGGIAQRSIGYVRIDDNQNITRAGIEGAFGEQYLRGSDGRRLKQKIGKGQWKPIEDYDQVEPQDGFDLYTTIDVNIQDIAHHALLEQLEKYKADHGSVVVMETKTGEIKAISNLGRNTVGNYYERLNYAVGESHEPGSTFKLMALAVALEDKVIDTSTVVDTEKGVLSFYGKKVIDSKRGGYGEISVAKAFAVSSNTGIVKVIHDSYKENSKQFIDGLYRMNLQNTLDLPIKGEGLPVIPDPRVKNKLWSGIALEWMAFGYGVSFTPLQTLTFYNAIANNGEMVKPRFLKEVKEFGSTIKSFDKMVINDRICSPETVSKLQALLTDVVNKDYGTGHGLYSKNFSMAGKTGTCQKNYKVKGKKNFPVENPKYSCIVVIHEPDKSVGYYGADVSGPVFKKVAQKIYTETPIVDVINDLEVQDSEIITNYESYFNLAKKYKTIMPDLRGMSAMDAISLLENMGMRVEIIGRGKVKRQSIAKGVKLNMKTKIVLNLS
jgi:cell division protein FtsI (penicillin-binding protein 3)